MKIVQKNYFLIFVASIVIFALGSTMVIEMVDINKLKKYEIIKNAESKYFLIALSEIGIDTDAGVELVFIKL